MPGSDAPPPDKAVKASYSIQADRMPFSFSYPEGSDVGYRWFDKTGAKPLYAFGHGLSYTQFAYDGLKVRGGKTITASFTVTNRGDRAGADVAQVYATAPGKAKRLIGWGRAMLAPGESRQFSVTADPRLLANFDVKKQAWVVKPGDYRVEVGMSAAEPVLTLNVKLSGQRISAKTGKPK
jgi:beta-glucosidase